MSLADDAAASPAADQSTPAPAEQAAAAPDVKTEPAAPSAAEGDKSESVFDAVNAALNPDKGTEAPPASDAKPTPTEDAPAKPEAEDEDDDPDAEEEEFTAEERAALNAKTRRSFDRLTKRVAEYKEPAERFHRIESFMQSTGVQPKEMVEAFNVLALVKSNPQEAVKRLREMTYDLSLKIGETLPDDLRQKVETGTVDEATARELAQTRARAVSAERVGEDLTIRDEEARVGRLKGEISSTITTWQTRISQRDPDFAAKEPLVSRAFKALVLEEGRPTTAAHALDLMKRAYKDVNADFGKLRPQVRAEVRNTPATSTTSAATTPKSVEEAIRNSFAA
jgi:hypothetical protein